MTRIREKGNEGARTEGQIVAAAVSEQFEVFAAETFEGRLPSTRLHEKFRAQGVKAVPRDGQHRMYPLGLEESKPWKGDMSSQMGPV